MEMQKVNGKKLTKKEARQLAYEKLVTALSEYKPSGKGKKFESNLRKTSKLFASWIIRANDTSSKDPKKKSRKKEVAQPAEKMEAAS